VDKYTTFCHERHDFGNTVVFEQPGIKVSDKSNLRRHEFLKHGKKYSKIEQDENNATSKRKSRNISKQKI